MSESVPAAGSGSGDHAVVVVGASWGGLNALTSLVGGLPGDFRAPLVVIQHRGRESRALLAGLLQDRTELSVGEARNMEPLLSGHIYVAPADHHLLLRSDHLLLDRAAPVRYSRPSIDVTFASAAEAFGRGAIGVILTGANADGARGLRRIVDCGGSALVQDPDSAEMPVMPRAAHLAVPEATILRLDRIARHLVSLIQRPEIYPA